MRIQTLAIIALLPGAGFAQIPNPGFMAPDTVFEAPGVPAPDQVNATDVLFAQLNAAGGLAEMALGELAADRAQSPAVADFARRMIDDHGAANDALAALATERDIALPDALSTGHQAMLARLEAVEDADFDLAYMRAQVITHQKAALLLMGAADGQNAGLIQFATATLPVVLDHLHMAQDIVADLALAQVAGMPEAPE